MTSLLAFLCGQRVSLENWGAAKKGGSGLGNRCNPPLDEWGQRFESARRLNLR